MPIEVMVPVIWGDKQEVEYDPKSKKAIRFSKSPAQFEIVSIKNGFIAGAETISGSSIGARFVFQSQKKSAAIKNQYIQEPLINAFTFVWPPERGDFMEYMSSAGYWVPIYGKRNGVGRIRFDQEVEVRPFKIRQFSKASRVVFKVPKIPGIPELKEPVTNLFDIELPELTFSYSSELQYMISQSTLTRWNEASSIKPVPADRLPLTFPAGSTPKDLLQKFAELSGETVLYDEETYTLSTD